MSLNNNIETSIIDSLLFLSLENPSVYLTELLSAYFIKYKISFGKLYAKIDVSTIDKDAFNFLLKELYGSLRDDRCISLLREVSTIKKNKFELFCENALKLFPPFEKFKEYQKVGSYLGVNREQNLIALDQGLGKTAVGISISEITKSKTLILSPAACKYNWLEELIEWGISKYNITMIDSMSSGGINKSISTEKYIIVNYDIISDEVILDYIIRSKVNHIILDECHKIKNSSSMRSIIVKELKNELGAKLTFLSGTPSPNRSIDMFNYLSLSSHVWGFDGNIRRFMDMFTDTRINRYGKKVTKSKNVEKLSIGIRNFLFRRTKKDINFHIQKIYHKIVIPMNDDVRQVYNEEMHKFIEKLKEKNLNTKSADIAMQRLGIIAANAKIQYIVNFARSYVNSNKHSVLQEYDSSFSSNAIKIVNKKEVLVKGKIIIYCSFNEPLDELERQFGESCLRIDGSVNQKKRLDIVNKFKSDNNIQYLIANLDSAGIGLNIVNKKENTANPPIYTVLHVTIPYTPAQLEQGNDRVHRMTQYVDCHIYNTVLESSIEEHILDIILDKIKETSLLIDRISVSDSDIFDVEIDMFEKLLEYI